MIVHSRQELNRFPEKPKVGIKDWGMLTVNMAVSFFVTLSIFRGDNIPLINYYKQNWQYQFWEVAVHLNLAKLGYFENSQSFVKI